MYILVRCSFDDVTSGIGIGIAIAVADSIGYRAPTWYQSHPNANWDQSTAFDVITLQQDIIYIKQGNRRLHFAPAVHSRHPFLPIGNAAYLQHAGRGPSHGHEQHTQKNLVKIARGVLEISFRTQRQTDALITILRNRSCKYSRLSTDL